MNENKLRSKLYIQQQEDSKYIDEDQQREQEDEAVEEPEEPEGDLARLYNKINSSRERPQVELRDAKIVRPIKCKLEFLENPDGSVQLFQGDTCIVASAYGPTEVRMAREQPHRAAIDVLFRSKITGTASSVQGDPIIEERAIEGILIGLFESIVYLDDEPGRGYNIILQEYENDGSLLSCCANAASLALIDAGCPLRSIVASVTILTTIDEKSLIVDPSQQQIQKGWSSIMTFIMNNKHEILFFKLTGAISDKCIKLCIIQALRAIDEIFEFFQELCIKKNSIYHYQMDTSNSAADTNQNFEEQDNKNSIVKIKNEESSPEVMEDDKEESDVSSNSEMDNESDSDSIVEISD